MGCDPEPYYPDACLADLLKDYALSASDGPEHPAGLVRMQPALVALRPISAYMIVLTALVGRASTISAKLTVKELSQPEATIPGKQMEHQAQLDIQAQFKQPSKMLYQQALRIIKQRPPRRVLLQMHRMLGWALGRIGRSDSHGRAKQQSFLILLGHTQAQQRQM